MNLGELAAALREAAARAEASLARDAVTAMVRVYVPILQAGTPVLSGNLRDSEYPDFIAGGGAQAQAAAGPHTIYARFRETGGTITSKGAWPLRNRATGQVFGRSVTQAGSHYMARAHDAAEGACHMAAALVAAEYLRDAGL